MFVFTTRRSLWWGERFGLGILLDIKPDKDQPTSVNVLQNHKNPKSATPILPSARSVSPLRCSTRHDAVVEMTREADTIRDRVTRRLVANRSCWPRAIVCGAVATRDVEM